MTYFVTGATGFIGRFLVQALLQRSKGTIYVLVRPRSMGKLDELREFWGKESLKRVVAIKGDLGQPKLGVGKADVTRLKGKIKHFYHLGAVYDLEASAEVMHKANIVGTQGALDFAAAVNAGCFHLVSSIAAAGLYRGTFTEDMFEEAEDLDHPYHRTKHDSEAMVRANGKLPFRVYRPGAVLGHSQTGFIDKIDGPYYFFKALQKLRESWPRWMPLFGVEGGYMNMVPVDFVVDALVHLSHLPKQDGACFHLTDPKVRRVGEVLNVFARAAHAPEMAFRLDPKFFAMAPEPVVQSIERSKPIQNVFNQVLRDLQHPPKSVLEFMNYPTRFDSSDDAEAAGQGEDPRARARGLRLALVGLLGTPPRPGSVDRSQLARRRKGQSRRDHRRLVGNRRGGRDPHRRGRRQGRRSWRVTKRSSPRCASTSRTGADSRRPTRATSPTWRRTTSSRRTSSRTSARSTC
jgi:thioester reductase-like protein